MTVPEIPRPDKTAKNRTDQQAYRERHRRMKAALQAVLAADTLKEAKLAAVEGLG